MALLVCCVMQAKSGISILLSVNVDSAVFGKGLHAFYAQMEESGTRKAQVAFASPA